MLEAGLHLSGNTVKEVRENSETDTRWSCHLWTGEEWNHKIPLSSLQADLFVLLFKSSLLRLSF